MASKLPAQGLAPDEILQSLSARQAGDWPWREGRSFSLVYHAGEAHEMLLREVYGRYLAANPLSARAFPSLARLEADIVSIVGTLLSGPPGAAGAMTSGGTESIILALKAYRDRARARYGVARESRSRAAIVVPRSAHPAFLKGAAYLDLEARVIDCGADFRAVPAAMAAACDGDTIALVASAPSFPQGVIDPIAELGAIAIDRRIGLHVDASLGSFVLPFAERLGHAVPPWDFRVPGVTSISADLHKFGYAVKGASVVVYRDAGLRRHQFFATDQWSGGLFASPGVLGTRPGGAIAAAWAALHAFGEDGYQRLVRLSLDVTHRLRDGITALGLRVLGAPAIGVFAFTADDGSIHDVADAMERRGWRLDRLQSPDSIHLIITAAHEDIADAFLADLAVAIEEARDQGTRGARNVPALLYGVTGNIAANGDRIAAVLDGLERRWDSEAPDDNLALRAEVMRPLADLLASGGDDRVVVDRASRRNPYGCHVLPRHDVSTTWSSCSASSALPRTHADATSAHAELIAAATAGQPGATLDACERLAAGIRRDLLAFVDIDAGAVDVVLTPSGTDAEFLPPLLIDSTHRMVSIVVASDDIGRGCLHAAGARHFSPRLPLGGETTPGERLAGFQEIETIPVRLRAEDGRIRTHAEIDGEVERAVTQARAEGAHVILHYVPCTKTGARVPSLTLVERLVARHDGHVTVVVDASQFRQDRDAARDYLSRGYLLVVTGSKFFGTLPFAGAVIVPRRDAARRRPLPSGMSGYLSRVDVPPDWTDWRAALTHTANVGLLLRWAAAANRISAYAELPEPQRMRALTALAAAMREAVGTSRCAIAVGPDGVLDATDVGDPSIVSFEVHLAGVAADIDTLRVVHRRLHEYESSPAAGDAGRRYLIGQPLDRGGGRGILRIAAGAAAIIDLATATRDEEFTALVDQARADLRDLFERLDAIAQAAPALMR